MKIETEKCTCISEFPNVLQYHLSEHCIVCSNCNFYKEIRVTNELNKEMVEWSKQYHKAYKEWLETDHNVEELTNPESGLNTTGFGITEKINAYNLTYYWLHTEEGKSYIGCPMCRSNLVNVENSYTSFHKICMDCKLLIHEM